MVFMAKQGFRNKARRLQILTLALALVILLLGRSQSWLWQAHPPFNTAREQQAWRQTQSESIREAAFLRLLKQSGNYPEESVFIAIEGHDPTRDLLHRLQNYRPYIAALSQCLPRTLHADEPPTDRITGRRGKIFHFGKLIWIDDTHAEVQVESWYRPLVGRGGVYRLEWKQGKWSVKDIANGWVS
jgi:hypothetical protein